VRRGGYEELVWLVVATLKFSGRSEGGREGLNQEGARSKLKQRRNMSGNTSATMTRMGKEEQLINTPAPIE